MKALLAITSLALLAGSTAALATQDTAPVWEAVTFKAGQYRVEVKTSPPSYRIAELKIWVSGKLVKIPRTEFEQISHPLLTRIMVFDVSQFRHPEAVPRAFLEIPFSGGIWVFNIEAGRYTGKELTPPRSVE